MYLLYNVYSHLGYVDVVTFFVHFDTNYRLERMISSKLN